MNYDLLLYWALMHEEEDVLSRISLTHDDGFRKDPADLNASYVEWQGERAAHSQNIHYLHGPFIYTTPVTSFRNTRG